MSILTLLIILLVVAILFGGYGSTRGGYGYWGWSPVGLIVIILLIYLLVGGRI